MADDIFQEAKYNTKVKENIFYRMQGWVYDA